MTPKKYWKWHTLFGEFKNVFILLFCGDSPQNFWNDNNLLIVDFNRKCRLMQIHFILIRSSILCNLENRNTEPKKLNFIETKQKQWCEASDVVLSHWNLPRHSSFIFFDIFFFVFNKRNPFSFHLIWSWCDWATWTSEFLLHKQKTKIFEFKSIEKKATIATEPSIVK